MNLARAAPALLCASLLACATSPVSELHTKVVADHVTGLAEGAAQLAQDAPMHKRCVEGDDPVAMRARALAEALAELRSRAQGRWASQAEFQEALNDISARQTELAILRAEYDHCRALSGPEPVPGDLDAGARRLAILAVQDPEGVLTPEARLDLGDYLVARLGIRFAVVPPGAVAEATAEHDKAGRCNKACARAVGSEVRANKVLTVTLAQEEARCSVVLELDDMATGITERARTVRSDCAPETVQAGIEDAVAPLAQ
ncbi:MAG: hypothetical protein H6730_32900 [Deltaproteobacteria bacterium]|nr:hypothetical protein [Deltaproteobacteria bacterium]